MLFFRFLRQVPEHHRRLLKRRGVPKPNWYVGAAEQPDSPRDPELAAELAKLKASMREYRERRALRGQSGAPREEDRPSAPTPAT